MINAAKQIEEFLRPTKWEPTDLAPLPNLIQEVPGLEKLSQEITERREIERQEQQVRDAWSESAALSGVRSARYAFWALVVAVAAVLISLASLYVSIIHG